MEHFCHVGLALAFDPQDAIQNTADDILNFDCFLNKPTKA